MADLCDADVLVHVVDATGRSDRDGNALGGGESGGDQDPDPAPDYTVCVYLSICPYVIMFVSVCLSVFSCSILNQSSHSLSSMWYFAVQGPALQKTLSGSERSCTDGSTVRYIIM